MSHLCDSTVASPTARRDNVLASKCEYPPFRYPLLNVPYSVRLTTIRTETITNENLGIFGCFRFRSGKANVVQKTAPGVYGDEI